MLIGKEQPLAQEKKYTWKTAASAAAITALPKQHLQETRFVL